MLECIVTFVELHCFFCLGPTNFTVRILQKPSVSYPFAPSNNSRFFRPLSHSLKEDLIESQKGTVGGRVLGWVVEDADTPLRDPCASLCGVSSTGFRDRGIRLIRYGGNAELTMELRSNRDQQKCAWREEARWWQSPKVHVRRSDWTWWAAWPIHQVRSELLVDGSAQNVIVYKERPVGRRVYNIAQYSNRSRLTWRLYLLSDPFVLEQKSSEREWGPSATKMSLCDLGRPIHSAQLWGVRPPANHQMEGRPNSSSILLELG